MEPTERPKRPGPRPDVIAEEAELLASFAPGDRVKRRWERPERTGIILRLHPCDPEIRPFMVKASARVLWSTGRNSKANLRDLVKLPALEPAALAQECPERNPEP